MRRFRPYVLRHRTCAVLVAALLAALAGCVDQHIETPDARNTDAAVALHLETETAAVVAGSADDAFTPVGDDPVALPASSGGASWLRLTLMRDWSGAEPPVLSARNTASQRIAVFVPRLGYQAELSRFDADAPAAFSRTALYFTLPTGLHAGDRIYVRSAQGRAAVLVALAPAAHAHAQDLEWLRWNLFATTVLAVVFVANAFFLMIERRSIFLYFSGSIGGGYLYHAFLYGEGFGAPVLGAARALGSLAWNLPAVVAIMCTLQFLRQLMRLSVYAPWFHRAVGAVIIGIAACFPLLIWSPHGLQFLPYALGNLLAMLGALAIIASAVLATHRGSRAARFVLVAWTPMITLAGLSAMQYLFGLWPGTPLGASYLSASALAAMTLALALADQTWQRKRELDAARHAAQTDVLSGALNRRAVDSRLRAAFDDARRALQPLALLFIDLDHFKAINDRFGHAVGDQCLRAIAAPIQAELRTTDTLGRWGGEEFVVVLPGAEAANAWQVAERIRGRIAALDIACADGPVELAASIGIGRLRPDMKTSDDLVNAADRALYRAKRAGRNRVMADTDLNEDQQPGAQE